MQQAGTSMNRLGTTAVSSHRALTIIKGGLLNVAATAAAVPGPIGHISTALVGMQLSTGGLLAILGVLAAAALLFKKLGDAAQRAADNVVAAADRMRKNLSAFVQAHADTIGIGRMGPEAQLGLEILRNRLVEAQAQLVRLQHPQTAADVLEHGPDFLDRSTTALTAQKNKIIETQQAINDLEKAVHDLRVKELRQWAADMVPIIKNLERIGGAVGSQARILRQPLGMRGMDPRLLKPVEADDAVLNLRLQLAGAFDKDNEKFLRLGESVGRTIMDGVIGGMQSMQDILRSIFLQLMEFALGSFIGSILHPGSSLGGLVKAGGSSQKLVGPVSMTGSLNMSGLQPLTAFAIARDPGFQQVIREAILVAGSQGFKG